jgi:NitT/TauT family transport system substrate-binding protein
MPQATIRIMVARHSAFYSPLISTIAAGFLRKEGIQSRYDVLPAGVRSHTLLRSGSVDVMQSAPGSNFGPIERGEQRLPVHFALINRRDGFFLSGREPDSDFNWKKLEGATLLADHGGQPLLMLRYAAHMQGVDWDKVNVVDAGDAAKMDAAFRAGQCDYIHQQGPAPQALKHEGIGHIVAAVGAAMPEVAFSTLMATREFLKQPIAKTFIQVYRQARRWVQESDPREVADKEASYFEGIDRAALVSAIERYQKLGCWGGQLWINREIYNQAVEVFHHGGAIKIKPAYEHVVVNPPDGQV